MMRVELKSGRSKVSHSGLYGGAVSGAQRASALGAHHSHGWLIDKTHTSAIP